MTFFFFLSECCGWDSITVLDKNSESREHLFLILRKILLAFCHYVAVCLSYMTFNMLCSFYSSFPRFSFTRSFELSRWLGLCPKPAPLMPERSWPWADEIQDRAVHPRVRCLQNYVEFWWGKVGLKYFWWDWTRAGWNHSVNRPST